MFLTACYPRANTANRSAFNPAEYGAVTDWYKSPDYSAGTWTAAIGANATQGTAGFQPTLVAGALNGYPAVRFDGVDDTLQRAASARPDEGSMFVVLSRRGVNAAFGRLVEIGANSNLAMVASADGLALQLQGGNNGVITTSNLTQNSYYVCTLIAETGASEGWLNGVSQGTHGLGVMTAASLTLTLSEYGGGGGFIWNGDIVEILIFSDMLNQANREAVENYLMQKYGLS